MAKRKKNFYAVKKGRITGIFDSWDDCKKAVDGYSGAEYKGFSNEYDAGAYLEGKKPDIVQTTVLNVSRHREPEESICYYAVRKGWKQGIFTTWKGCWQAIDGYSGSEAKGFATETEAVQYMYADNVCGENPVDNEEKEYMESCYMDIHLDDDEGDIPFE